MRWIVVAGTPRLRKTEAALLVGASTAAVRRSLRLRPSQSPEMISTPEVCSARTSSAKSSVLPEPALPTTAMTRPMPSAAGVSVSLSRSTPMPRSAAAMLSWAWA